MAAYLLAEFGAARLRYQQFCSPEKLCAKGFNGQVKAEITGAVEYNFTVASVFDAGIQPKL